MGSGALVGFVGSRSLSPQFAPLVRAVVVAVQEGGRGIAVGCSPGLGAFVRAAAPQAVVFSVQSVGFSGRGAFAARAAALVRAVAASGPGAALFAFAVRPCPAQVAPSPSPSRCFCGGGSGTWAELALAVGLGLPVSVFWCAPGAPVLPSWWPGSWSPSWSPASPTCREAGRPALPSVQVFSFAPAVLF